MTSNAISLYRPLGHTRKSFTIPGAYRIKEIDFLASFIVTGSSVTVLDISQFNIVKGKSHASNTEYEESLQGAVLKKFRKNLEGISCEHS